MSINNTASIIWLLASAYAALPGAQRLLRGVGAQSTPDSASAHMSESPVIMETDKKDCEVGESRLAEEATPKNTSLTPEFASHAGKAPLPK